jgi:Zn-dependent protease with chaperone function
MNFFEQQDRSRRATRMLVGLFTAAVLFICTCVYFAVMLSVNATSLRWTVFGDRACQSVPVRVSSSEYPRRADLETSIPVIPFVDRAGQRNYRSDYNVKGGFGGFRSSGGISRLGNRANTYDRSTDRSDNSVKCLPQMVWGDLGVFFWTVVGTTAIIGGASWWKIQLLQAGGAVIAAELGGRRVIAEIASPQERQLLNVVEEMALAATIPVPSVYVLYNEVGINAFAAGLTVDDAAIGVTRECLEHLTRDELQGLVAHEFSHILNGDMAMNIRLTGLLHGILFLNLTGRVLSVAGWGRDNPVGNLGILLRIIGFSGFVSGRMIQAAISRQRELLADASAVQFTRNPDGIAGVLEKTVRYTSYLDSPYAEASSHIFFSPALKPSLFGGLFATHPSPAQRMQIARGVGKKLGTRIVINGEVVPTFKPIERIDPIEIESDPLADKSAPVGGYSPLAYTYTLLLECDRAIEQLVELAQLEEPSVLEHIETLRSEIDTLPPHQRLATLDLQLATLRDTEHAPRLVKCAYRMVTILPPKDWHTSIVYLILHHRLTPSAGNHQEIYHSVEDVWAEIANILGTLARLSSDQPENIEYTFKSGLLRLPAALSKGTKLPPEINWQEFHTDLLKIAEAAPKVKQSLITACLEILSNQLQISTAAADLMRSIAILLDCPIPPLIERLALTDGNRISTHQRTHS